MSLFKNEIFFLMKNLYQAAVLLVLSIFFVSCSTDMDDINRYNIEGQWRLEGIYTYDLEGDLIDSKYYDTVWDIKKDSIEYTNTYHFSDGFGPGVLQSKFSYKTYSDGTFYHSEQMFKIDVLTEDDLIFSIKRPKYIDEFRYYSID